MVGVLLVTWAATVGPSAGAATGTVLRSWFRAVRVARSASTTEPPDGQTDAEEAAESDGSAAGDLLVNILTVILVGCAVVAVGLLGFGAHRGLRHLREAGRERRGEVDPEETGFAVIGAPTRLAHALSGPRVPQVTELARAHAAERVRVEHQEDRTTAAVRRHRRELTVLVAQLEVRRRCPHLERGHASSGSFSDSASSPFSSSSRFSSLPVALRGNSSMKTISRGTL